MECLLRLGGGFEKACECGQCAAVGPTALGLDALGGKLGSLTTQTQTAGSIVMSLPK